jgi:3-oxoacyl-[acyl-carrier-protein] synthase II
MRRRVVITGMDIISSLGNGLDAFWHKAVRGYSGIKKITSYDPASYTTQIAGEVDLSQIINPANNTSSKRYPRAAQYALHCANNAMTSAGLDNTDKQQMGTFIGTSLGGMPEQEQAYQVFFEHGWRKIPALTVLKGMPNSIANHIAISHGLGGMNHTFSNACVSSADAIGHAFENIRSGRINIALCGGTESLIWPSLMAAWCKLRVLSTDNDTPEQACRPFDATRSGMVMADGAAFLVLENYDSAKARGAPILAEITGFGSSCDAHHVTAPDSNGQVRAVEMALKDAGLSYKDIDYINAHGTGTSLNDLTETQTIKYVFKERSYDLPITAQKSMTGHAIGAAGAMEIVASVLCLQHNTLLPTINLNNPDPQCDLDYVANSARPKKINTILSHHFAFGGANDAIILQRI